MNKYCFDAVIQAAGRGGAYVLFPFDVAKEFGSTGRIPVEATLNGIPYRGSLIKYGHPQHMLPVLKPIREQSGTAPGDTVHVELWKDDERRKVEVPEDFRAAMEKAGVAIFFDSLSFTNQKEYCRWISEAKKPETRVRRLAQALDLLGNAVRTPADRAAAR